MKRILGLLVLGAALLTGCSGEVRVVGKQEVDGKHFVTVREAGRSDRRMEVSKQNYDAVQVGSKGCLVE